MSNNLIPLFDDETPRHDSDNPKPGCDKYGKTPKRRKINRYIITTLWSLFAIFFIGAVLFFTLIYNGVIGYMPDLQDLKNPDDKFASIIYTADGEEMGRYFKGSGNRVYADYSDISPNVINALIATEDSRFTEHSGVDFIAFTRVGIKTLLMRNESSGGGSTITQQLAKMLYTQQPASGTVDRAMQKCVEWMIAVKLERYYSKEEIIKLYLNQFDFLYNAVGIRSAANIYFNKEAKDLEVHEAAMLVGMLKNPSAFNPVRRPEKVLSRRSVVFGQMEKAGMLTQQQVDSLNQLPLGLNFRRVDHKDGIAPYFREELRRVLTAKKPERSKYPSWNQQSFVDDSIAWETDPLFGWIEKNPKPDGSKYNIYTDGLRIYTTIDSRMQRYAEDAVYEHMSDLQRRFFREKKGAKGAPYTTNRNELSQKGVDNLLKSAIKQSERSRIIKLAHPELKDKPEEMERVIMEEFNKPVEMTVFSYAGPVDTVMTPRDSVIYHKHFLRTGFMSMEPGTGHVKAYVGGPSFTFFQYDMAATGRRQIGSTAKPFLYAYAMDEGFTPCSEFLNSQPTIIDEAGNIWQPRNSGKARIDEMVTLRWALTNSNNWISAQLMNELKPATLVRYMHSFGITNHIDPVLSLSLGVCDVSVKEMVSAYTAFANDGGMHSTPVYVTAITDSNGNIISRFSTHQNKVLSDIGHQRILSILLNVVDSGTGARLRRAPYNLTAQMGGKTGTTNFNADGWFMAVTPQLVSGVWVGGEERYIHFNRMADGQGAEMALPIYGKYITKVYNDASLPYTQSVRFSLLSEEELCQDEYYGEYVEESAEESFSGVFD